MAVKILERERLKKAVERVGSLNQIERVLDLQRETDHVEIGGEAYLAERPETLLLRNIPHEFDYFSGFLAELSEGVYIERHFREMRDFLERDIKLTKVNRRISINLLRRMGAFQKNGCNMKESREIGKEYRNLLKLTYYKPGVKKLSYGLYIADWHVHNNGERPSADDRQIAAERPELVIISNANFYRSAGLVYLYTNDNREKVRRFKFGPYNLFSKFII